jgi:hypothetical protein
MATSASEDTSAHDVALPRPDSAPIAAAPEADETSSADPVEYGDDETLSVTERELRQYAEQRSEFEERLREFWKDADQERAAETDDERRFRLWKRERRDRPGSETQ